MRPVILSFLFLLISSFTVAQQWSEVINPLYGDYNGTHGDVFGRAVSLNNQGNRIVVGDPSSSKNNQFDGRVSIFEQIDDNWHQIGQEIYGGEENAFLGGAVALNGEGNTFITTSNALSGEFRVYELINGEWSEKGSILPTLHDKAVNISVSINDAGDCVAVLGTDSGFPIVYSVLIYSWDSIINDWVQKGAKYNMQERETGNYTNGTIELSSDGNTIIIGNPIFEDLENSNSSSPEGRVKVLYWDDGQWKQKGEPFIGADGEKIGHNVNISSDGNTILMGAPLNDNFGQNAGEIKLYHWVNNSWLQKGNTFTSIDPTWNSHFASSLNANGNIFAFWSHEDIDGGGVQVFCWKNDFWEQIGTDILKSLDGDGPRNNFISLNDGGCKVAIGVPMASNRLGRVNIFEFVNIEDVEVIELCEGDTIFINEIPYFEEGKYLDTLHSMSCCDTTRFFDIQFADFKTSYVTFECCVNNTVSYEGQELEVGFEGQFNYSVSGLCDSIVFVEVIELANDTIEEYEYICQDSFLLLNDEPISAGATIEISLLSSLGCDSIILKHVEEYEYNNNFLPENLQNCNQKINLTSPSTSTIWSTGDVGKSIEVSESGIVIGTYMNEFECSVKDTVNIQLENTNFYIPNIFNPTSSLGNECFQVLFSTDTKIDLFQLAIFDRWGNLVWRTQNSEDCWDGMLNQGKMVSGVYVWYLEFKNSNCNIITRKYGDVTLIK